MSSPSLISLLLEFNDTSKDGEVTGAADKGGSSEGRRRGWIQGPLSSFQHCRRFWVLTR